MPTTASRIFPAAQMAAPISMIVDMVAEGTSGPFTHATGLNLGAPADFACNSTRGVGNGRGRTSITCPLGCILPLNDVPTDS